MAHYPWSGTPGGTLWVLLHLAIARACPLQTEIAGRGQAVLLVWGVGLLPFSTHTKSLQSQAP